MGGCGFKKRTSGEEAAEDVDLEALPPGIRGGGGQGLTFGKYGGVVDEDVDGADGLEDGGESLVDGFRIGDVGGEDVNGAFRRRGLELLLCGDEMRLAAAEEDDVLGSGVGEGGGDPTTYAAATTGDEDGLVGGRDRRILGREGRVGLIAPGGRELGKEVGHWTRSVEEAALDRTLLQTLSR